MAINLKNAANQYDAIVVGAGVAGLILAKKLITSGANVAILERQPSETYNAKSKLGDFLNVDLMLGLKGEENLLSPLCSELGLNSLPSLSEFEINTFESSEFKTFYGFSENRYASCDSLLYFNHREFYDISEGLFLDRSHFSDDTLNSIVFGAEVSKLDVSENGGGTITTNAEKQFSAREIFITLPFEECKGFLPTQLLPAKVQMKLKKSQKWAAVHLVQYFGDNSLNTKQISLFLPTQRDGCEPAFGRIIGLEQGQVGIWTSMIPVDQLADSEVAAQTVRFLKKSLTKAFGDKVDGAKQRILVVPHWWTQPIDISKEIVAVGTHSKIYLCDKSFHSQTSPMAAQASGIFAHLDCRTPATVLETTPT